MNWRRYYMAIKNTNLGGTNWAAGDIVWSADLNDTFDAVQGL